MNMPIRLPWKTAFRAFLLVPFVYFLVVGSLAAQTTGSSEADQLILRASQLARQGDFDGAIATYQRAIKLAPKYALLHSYLGSAFESKGSYAEAAQAYETAITIQQNERALPRFMANTYLHAANSYLLLNRPADAEARVDRALQYAPDDPNALSTKGILLEMRGKLDDAITCYRK